MEYIRKHLYWDIYGVKTFPYRGKRKYFPCIYQDYDGTIMIRNDVFGCTIAQFERQYKALLKRRKENEAFIQNIRFPVKSTNEYIEYLKYGDDTVEGYSSDGDGVLTDEQSQLCQLIQVAGTEYEIRIRQRMFVLIDNTVNMLCPNRKQYISSGSLAEGIHLTGSDIDTMYVFENVTVTDNIEFLCAPITCTTFLMEYDIRYPGFCKLKRLARNHCNCVSVVTSIKTEHGMYLSTKKFLRQYFNQQPSKSASIHGPCISDANQYFDRALCFKSRPWPNIALDWCFRHRKGQWPSTKVIDLIVKDGCLVVPVGPKNSDNEIFWRISFSMAEKRLTHSFNYAQLLCYVILKLTLKKIIIYRNNEVKDLLCSYFLKTTLFWLSEEISINTFKITNLSQCFFLCLDKLSSFVRDCYCPNYFIPQHNMFTGKITEWNNKPLLSILVRLGETPFSTIIGRILSNSVMRVSDSHFIKRNELSLDVELLFYRVADVDYLSSVESFFKALQYIESIMSSESSEFLVCVLKYYYAVIKQKICQLFVIPNRTHDRYKMDRTWHKYLCEGTKTDAVSGWLLYASFYYILGEYKKTLQIVKMVLSRCTPDMIFLQQNVYTADDKDTYQHKTENSVTLGCKMRQATVKAVLYIKQSTLIPQELKLEVQDTSLSVPPVVMSQCLQFLCYHHLGLSNNKHRALSRLELTVKEGYCLPPNWFSESLVILGVCNELSGDRNAAYHSYHDACLHNDSRTWKSPEQRLKNLFRT